MNLFAFHARRFDTLLAVEVRISEGRIEALRPLAGPGAGNALPLVAPGLVDIQINGYGGQEFSSPALTPEKVAAIVRQHFEFGVTALCPTLTTQSLDVLSHGLRTIAAACEADRGIGGRVVGIHLEGPFISPEDGPRGAHPAEHCRLPDWDLFCRLQDAAGGRIVLLTMSVEFDEAPLFIERAVASGVVVSIGHTGASSRQIRAAVDAGASLSTHLGNGAHRMLRRHPNYLWDQLAEDRLHASLIVDGHHLPPEVVKTFVRAKTPQRCILVSDVSGLAGLPPGRYTGSGCELEILADGRLVIAGQDQLLAGASRPLGAGIANVMAFAGVNLAAAIAMATANPLQLLRRPWGTLRPGDAADLVLFEVNSEDAAVAPACATAARFHVRATIAGGEVVFGRADVRCPTGRGPHN
jgi:N-acetylglucosamine-6-phosphate deacetylase